MSHRIIWQVKCGTGSDHCFVLVVAKSHWVFCMAIPKSRCCARGKFNRSMTTAKRSTSFMTIIVMFIVMMSSYGSQCVHTCRGRVQEGVVVGTIKRLARFSLMTLRAQNLPVMVAGIRPFLNPTRLWSRIRRDILKAKYQQRNRI